MHLKSWILSNFVLQTQSALYSTAVHINYKNMADTDVPTKKRQREVTDEEEDVGPLPNHPPKKPKQKKRNVQFHSLYLDQLPSQAQYEKSYMHRAPLTHIEVAKTDFIITASSDGQIDFWKKEPTGIRFYKKIRAHMGSSYLHLNGHRDLK